MKYAIFAAAAVAAAGTVASADSFGSLEMKYRGGGLLQGGLGYQADQIPSGSVSSGTGGELRHETRNRTGAATNLPVYVSSFCIELGQVTSGSWRTFEVTSILNAPNPETNSPGGSGYGETVQRRIHSVVRAAIDAGIIDARLQPVSGTTQQEMAAVQLGIWEAIWEQSGTLSLAGGTSTASTTNSAVNSALSGILSSANNFMALEASEFGTFKVAGLVALASSNAQDQLAIVPLPPAAFAGLGLLGVAGVARRLRK